MVAVAAVENETTILKTHYPAVVIFSLSDEWNLLCNKISHFVPNDSRQVWNDASGFEQ
jgi:hypothetical protein